MARQLLSILFVPFLLLAQISSAADVIQIKHTSRYAENVKRDSHGHIARSSKAKHEFMKAHPCPSTGNASGKCPGYVIDHIVPLKRGGADAPSNMQWQTIEEAKAKDKWE